MTVIQPTSFRSRQSPQVIDQNRRSAIAREALQAIPLRLGHFPRWASQATKRVGDKLGIRVTRRYSPPDHGSFAVCLARLGERHSSLDHWGSCIARGRHYFVSEPYEMPSETLKAWEEFADLAGLMFSLSPNSWHYPGSCFRLQLWVPLAAKPVVSPNNNPPLAAAEGAPC